MFRLEDYRIPDWESQGNAWRIPRSSLTPILRFADVEAFVQQFPPPPSPALPPVVPLARRHPDTPP